MFFTFFRRELATGLRQPMVYIFMGIVALLVFFAVVSDNVMIGGAVGDVHKNAPDVVGSFVGIMSVFGLLFATAFFNNAALRDYKYNFNQILFSTPISKAGYYFGRFCGAWLLASLVMAGVYVGMTVGGALGPVFQWVAPERLGPTPWGAYASSFVLQVLPNMLLAGALIFLLATRFRSTIISFVGTLLIFMGYIASLNWMSDMDNQAMAAMIDLFGVSAYQFDTQYLTPAERNVMGPAFAGALLKNRLLWTTIGLGVLAVGYALFSFSTGTEKVKKSKKAKAETRTIAPVFQPVLPDVLVPPTAWQSFCTFFSINFLSMFRSSTFVILLLFAVIFLLSNIWGGFEYFGLKSYPVTYKMMDEVNNMSGLFVAIVLVFFSGELVWRDRDNHLNEVIDGTPHPSLMSLLAKAASLVALAAILHLVMIGVAVLYQASTGYTNFELGVYMRDFWGDAFIGYLALAAMLVFIQVVVNQKYLGYFVAILILFVLDLILLAAKVETNMLIFGSTPATPYSDMNGFGPGVEGHFWFSMYWLAFGLLLTLTAALVWPRGMAHTLKARFAAGRKSLSTAYFGALGLSGAAFVGLAGFVYYNTQVLNPYDTSYEQELQQVEYEKQYGHLRDLPTVKIVDVKYRIDLYPSEHAARGGAELVVVNRENRPLDSLVFILDESYTQAVDIPDSRVIHGDEKMGFYIYQLKRPLAPGDSLRMTTTFDYTPQGFSNSVENMSVVENGTFLNNMDVLPRFGYSADYEVSDKNKRRKYELPERKAMPDLQTNCSAACSKNYLTNGSADWVTVETFISTEADQIAIAPGSLISKKERDGRVQYHYRVDHPSQNFYSFISARYEVARRKWKDVDIEVYYHPAHSVNVPRMLDAVEKSLVYFTDHFGPYYHRQARIIEFPRYASFAQAFPGTMPYSEALGFITNLEDETKNNVVDAVIAHEMAHQWWAHQVIGADMKGSTMLSESFAEYSSLMVMKQTTDALQMKDFLKYDLQRYLRGRSSETEAEQPLMKVENQAHIHYGKGSVILYALQDYIGEARVNAALRGFLEEYRYVGPPYPNAHDFMRHLRPQVPDSLAYLLTDWFEDITLYDLRTTAAKATELPGGQYEVTLDVYAMKQKADGTGNTTDAAIADWIDIGLYADRDEKTLLLRERVYLDKPTTQLTFRVDSRPAKAAIDPLTLLIDRVRDDNVKVVE